MKKLYQDLYKKIIPYINERCIVTSNTSGLSLESLSKDLPVEFLNKFFITHFFNPPRYMKLVEIISSSNTNKDLVNIMDNFLTNVHNNNPNLYLKIYNFFSKKFPHTVKWLKKL